MNRQSAHRPIRVLVVDDSSLTRQMLADGLTASGRCEVVGFAADGLEALEQIERLAPDVVTLDIQMPRCDGLATLDALLERRPTPVVVVSSQTRRASEAALAALDRGALDYVPKPEGGSAATEAMLAELVRKVRSVAGANVRRVLEIRRQRASVSTNTTTGLVRPTSNIAPECLRRSCIAIGISTGGPPALAHLFRELAPPLPPIVVVQHMPRAFTQAFAARLDGGSRLTIKEAEAGELLQVNTVYIAPGDRHLELRRERGQVAVALGEQPPVSGHRPSVDVLMQSVAAIFGRRAIGVIMTGMGRDGVAGCVAIRRASGFVLGQDEDSSAVYGMNRAAALAGAVDEQQGLEQLASRLMELVEDRCGAAMTC